MGLRGPRPTPTAILKLRGSNRPGRKNRRREPKRIGKIRKPDNLDPFESKVWDQLIGDLKPTGMLGRMDANTLARYCTLFMRYRKAEEFLKSVPSTSIPLRNDAGDIVGFAQLPQVNQCAKLAVLLLQIEREFGMTPSARTRIQVDPPEEKADPFAKFLEGTG